MQQLDRVTASSKPWAALCRWRSAALAVVGIGAVVALVSLNMGAPAGDKRLWIPPERLDFGEVWQEKRFEWILPIENRANREITIAELISNCGCAVIELEPRPLTIPAGGKANLRAILDLTPPDGPKVGASRRIEFEFGVKLRNEGPQTFSLRGVVRTPVALDPMKVDFGETLVVGTEHSSRRVVVHELWPLGSVACEADSNCGIAELSASEGGKRILTFQPRPDLGAGEHPSVVRLICRTPEGDALPPVEIPVKLTILPELRAMPAKLYLGHCSPGGELEGEVVLQSARARAFSVV
ncbi:MAG: hypothetical protein HYS13_04890, partial [Planctomycetia bacterium]|nr:hypothetical protein [Planctomycetia bacterium]